MQKGNKKAPYRSMLKRNRYSVSKVSFIYLVFSMFAYVLCIYKVYTKLKIAENKYFVTKVNNKFKNHQVIRDTTDKHNKL